ncbi:D-alanyl-D-alanine carboxypeptidase [Clostridiaceae bacterium JG1575]|nr:D-alanyl-D-alanine carboxypeptidase [Clostridiaceae bacterium JG1575]
MLLLMTLALILTTLLTVQPSLRQKLVQKAPASLWTLLPVSPAFSVWTQEDDSLLQELTLAQIKEETPNCFKETLRLINRKNPLPRDYTPSLVPLSGDLLADPDTAAAYTALAAGAQEPQRPPLWIVSAYRTRALQEKLHQKDALFTLPAGASEHQAGLALDLASSGKEGPDFDQTGWPDYIRGEGVSLGFILRYPKGKEAITGVPYEPWHFRYVGPLHAALMAERDLTLEEYHALLSGNPQAFLSWRGYLVCWQSGPRFRQPPNTTLLELCPTNTNGYILTFKKTS